MRFFVDMIILYFSNFFCVVQSRSIETLIEMPFSETLLQFQVFDLKLGRSSDC